MATMLSRAVLLAENLGRLSGPKVRQAGGSFRARVNRGGPVRARCPGAGSPRTSAARGAAGARETEAQSASERERRSPCRHVGQL